MLFKKKGLSFLQLQEGENKGFSILPRVLEVSYMSLGCSQGALFLTPAAGAGSRLGQTLCYPSPSLQQNRDTRNGNIAALVVAGGQKLTAAVSSRHGPAGQQDPAPGPQHWGDVSPRARSILPYCPLHAWLVILVSLGAGGQDLAPALPPSSSQLLSGKGTAAGFLLLRLDVVVDLEAGLVQRLHRALLQLPGVVGPCYCHPPPPVPV